MHKGEIVRGKRELFSKSHVRQASRLLGRSIRVRDLNPRPCACKKRLLGGIYRKYVLRIYPFTWAFGENERKIAEASAIGKKRLLGLFSRRRRQKGAFFLGVANSLEMDGNGYRDSGR